MLRQVSFLTEGHLITSLLRDRGRTRSTFSNWITSGVQKELESLRAGILLLPSGGSYNLPPISLTSWPPRYNSLPLVLLNLLSQDLLPPKIYVWLSKEDYSLFDEDLMRIFENSIVEFHKTEDYGPHKKWIPMVLNSEKPFVICDDDIFYPRSWYRRLVSSDDGESYIAHQCHQIATSSLGESISPYSSWKKNVQDVKNPSHRLFAIGCGGTLLYPERISTKYRDWQSIVCLCPKADDIWLKLAHLDKGVPCRKTNYSFPCIEYVGSQSVSLLSENVNAGGNDIQIQKALGYLNLDLSKLFVA